MKEAIMLGARVPKELKNKLHYHCEKEGRSVQWVVNKLLKEWIEEQEKEGK